MDHIWNFPKWTEPWAVECLFFFAFQVPNVNVQGCNFLRLPDDGTYFPSRFSGAILVVLNVQTNRREVRESISPHLQKNHSKTRRNKNNTSDLSPKSPTSPALLDVWVNFYPNFSSNPWLSLPKQCQVLQNALGPNSLGPWRFTLHHLWHMKQVEALPNLAPLIRKHGSRGRMFAVPGMDG